VGGSCLQTPCLPASNPHRRILQDVKKIYHPKVEAARYNPALGCPPQVSLLPPPCSRWGALDLEEGLRRDPEGDGLAAGQEEGDALLGAAGGSLRSSIRKRGVVCFYFVVFE